MSLHETHPEYNRTVLPVATFATQIVESDLMIANVSIETRRDWIADTLIHQMRTLMVASKPKTVRAEVRIKIPKQTRGNAWRIWLRQDIQAGRFIRRFWDGPSDESLEWEWIENADEHSYNERFCPHIAIEKQRAHYEFLTLDE